jgi:hypothetical protein
MGPRKVRGVKDLPEVPQSEEEKRRTGWNPGWTETPATVGSTEAGDRSTPILPARLSYLPRLNRKPAECPPSHPSQYPSRRKSQADLGEWAPARAPTAADRPGEWTEAAGPVKT